MLEQNSVVQLLKDLRDVIAREGNGRTCIGYETVSVTNAAVVNLNVPLTAQSAEITVSSAGSTNPSMAVRYTIDNSTNPVTGAVSSAGVDLGDFDTVEILGNTNLNAFRVIASDAVNTKYLKVHYFN